MSDSVRVRPARSSDNRAIARLGHPSEVAGILSPPPGRLLQWRLTGTPVRSFVAIDRRDEALIGSVQFVRSRGYTGTWMFGHWRVASSQRRRGIGRRLLEEGMEQLPDARRLYSFISADNSVSIAAHGRLGFEPGRTLWGSATLASLSTLGPPAPAVVIAGVRGGDRDALFGSYARSMGTLWLRLFPGMGPRSFLEGAVGGLGAVGVALVRAQPVADAGVGRAAGNTAKPVLAGFVVWEGPGATFFAEPALCDPGLLARVATGILRLGARRDRRINLRGLPASFADRQGPVELQVLMGMPDVATQWRA